MIYFRLSFDLLFLRLFCDFPFGVFFLTLTFAFFPKQFTVRGSQFFLKMCPPFVSLLVSALFGWPCSMSFHLFSRSVRPFPLAMQRFYSFVCEVCHCWCPPFSAGDATFLFIPHIVCRYVGFLNSFLRCFFIPLLVSALFRWPCSISIHLFPMWFVYFCFPGSVPALLASALFPSPAFLFIFVSQVISALPQTGYC